jgi:two-component system chemotaxis response regulator CheY
MRAIIIDDSRAMRGILKRIVGNFASDIVEAADGADALQKLAGQPAPNLAMVDWNMPNMNGYQFIQAARSNPAYNDTTIVMVTTEVEMHQMVAALEAGAQEYVMKPFTEDALIEKLEALGFSRKAA